MMWSMDGLGTFTITDCILRHSQIIQCPAVYTTIHNNRITMMPFPWTLWFWNLPILIMLNFSSNCQVQSFSTRNINNIFFSFLKIRSWSRQVSKLCLSWFLPVLELATTLPSYPPAPSFPIKQSTHNVQKQDGGCQIWGQTRQMVRPWLMPHPQRQSYPEFQFSKKGMS